MEMVLSSGFCELSQREQSYVNGGSFPWGELAKEAIKVAVNHPVMTCVVIGAAAAYACWQAGQEVGEDLGEFIYNVTH